MDDNDRFQTRTAKMTTETAFDQLANNSPCYVIVGENHRDETVSEEVVEPLLESGDFSHFYLEALTRGSYQQQGDDLKQIELPPFASDGRQTAL